MSKQHRRRVSILVSPQTLYHLENMRQFCGYSDLGRVIDKLVREKRESMNESKREGVRNHARSECQNRRQNW